MVSPILRPLTPNDMPQIINLWHIVFGDSPLFIRSLFNHFPVEQIGWGVLLPSHHLVAIAFTLPLNVPQQKGYYLYACATAPNQQGHGYQSALLRHLIQTHQQNGTDLLLTLPATESLFTFYNRFGFRNVSFVREVAPTLPSYSPIDPTQYLTLRLQSLPYPAVESKTYLHWSINEMQKEGFQTYETPLPDRTLYTLSSATDSNHQTADCFTRFHSQTLNPIEQLNFTAIVGMALSLSHTPKPNKYYFSFLQD